MKDKDVVAFINLLEEAGCEYAKNLVRKILIPLAKEKGISLMEAADRYADDGEEQDTSEYQLWLALTRISEESIQALDIHKPL